MQLISEAIGDIWAEKDEVGQVFLKAYQIMYDGKDEDILCKLRYNKNCI